MSETLEERNTCQPVIKEVFNTRIFWSWKNTVDYKISKNGKFKEQTNSMIKYSYD